MTATVLRGDAHHLPLPDASVDLICTSPPYFGLRSYTDGGEHYAGQIGSEATPAEWLAAMVECTREWVRVLKPEGSLFVNLGDKYASGGRATYDRDDKGINGGAGNGQRGGAVRPLDGAREKSLLGLPWRYALATTDQLGLILRRDIIWSKPNGLPESVTDRCRSSHEYVFHLVRQPRYFSAVDEIREPTTDYRGTQPQSLRDRTAALKVPGNTPMSGTALEPNPLGKLPGSVWRIPEDLPRPDGARHWPASEATMPVSPQAAEARPPSTVNDPSGSHRPGQPDSPWVWSIPSQPLTVPPALGVDHFAAFPMELPRRIIAGWSPAGVCTACGQGRRPVTHKTLDLDHMQRRTRSWAKDGAEPFGNSRGINGDGPNGRTVATITGYTCACTTDLPRPGTSPERTGPGQPPTRPAVVLDPFGGTGTTALVASALGRHGISIDMSADYTRLARWRCSDPAERAKALQVPKPPAVHPDQDALFEVTA